MSEAYRAPGGEAVARVRGGNLLVQAGATLPPLCIICGGRERLTTKTQRFTKEWNSSVFAPLLSTIVSPLIDSAVGTWTTKSAGTATLTYSLCVLCERRAENVVYGRAGIGIGGMIGLVAGATVGFNGAPAAGIVIVAASVAAAVLVRRRFIRGRRFFVVLTREGGLLLRGVHGNVAQAALARQLEPPAQR